MHRQLLQTLLAVVLAFLINTAGVSAQGPQPYAAAPSPDQTAAQHIACLIGGAHTALCQEVQRQDPHTETLFLAASSQDPTAITLNSFRGAPTVAEFTGTLSIVVLSIIGLGIILGSRRPFP